MTFFVDHKINAIRLPFSLEFALTPMDIEEEEAGGGMGELQYPDRDKISPEYYGTSRPFFHPPIYPTGSTTPTLRIRSPTHPPTHLTHSILQIGLTSWEIIDLLFDKAAENGILVLLDMHTLDPEKGVSRLWYDPEKYSEATVLWGWERIVLRYADHWNLFALVRTPPSLFPFPIHRSTRLPTYAHSTRFETQTMSHVHLPYPSNPPTHPQDIMNECHDHASWGKGDPETDFNEYVQRFILFMDKHVPQFQGLFFVEVRYHTHPPTHVPLQPINPIHPPTSFSTRASS